MNPIRVSHIIIGIEYSAYGRWYKGSNPALCRISILPNVYRPISNRLNRLLYE